MESASEDSDAGDQSTDNEDKTNDQHDEDLLTLQNLENCNDEELNDLEQDKDDDLIDFKAETSAALKIVSVLLTKVRGIFR